MNFGNLTNQLMDSFVRNGGEVAFNCEVDQLYPSDHGKSGDWVPSSSFLPDLGMPIPDFFQKPVEDLSKGMNSWGRSFADNLNFTQKVAQGQMAQETAPEDVSDKKLWGLTLYKTGPNSRLDILDVHGKFVFVGAGGNSLIMLEKSGIPEVAGYGGFPVSGEFLICKNQDVVKQHINKTYGLAEVGAPPMSVPHLDRRIIDGQECLLFGPFAGFSPNFLKNGSSMDLLTSLNPFNLIPMAAAGAQNADLSVYLGKELLKSHHQQMDELRKFWPTAKDEDWIHHTAGQRVQIMKYDSSRIGVIQFGTEIKVHKDRSIAGLMGASPGASVSVRCALETLERCFPERLEQWKPQLEKMIPAYGKKLNADPKLAAKVVWHTAKVLDIKDMSNVFEKVD